MEKYQVQFMEVIDGALLGSEVFAVMQPVAD